MTGRLCRRLAHLSVTMVGRLAFALNQCQTASAEANGGTLAHFSTKRALESTENRILSKKFVTNHFRIKQLRGPVPAPTDEPNFEFEFQPRCLLSWLNLHGEFLSAQSLSALTAQILVKLAI
jgi:hypothetical protein